MIINDQITRSYTQSRDRSLILNVKSFHDKDVVKDQPTVDDSSGKLANLAYMLTVQGCWPCRGMINSINSRLRETRLFLSHLFCFSCRFSWQFAAPVQFFSLEIPVSSLASPPSLGVSGSPPVGSVPFHLFLLQISCLTMTYLRCYNTLIMKKIRNVQNTLKNDAWLPCY